MVAMLPLVRDVNRQWRAGWVSYSDGFPDNPDIEVFCGGENEKTARAAACWRQGNLLHFGFEQGPAELNETGRHLLLNCIAYISRFKEDRPIAVTPSIFAGPVAEPRGYIDRRLGQKGDLTEAGWLITSTLLDQLKGKDRAQVREWYAANRCYFHPAPEPKPENGQLPGATEKLDIDPDALALGVPLDRVEFFTKALTALGAGGAKADQAERLLARYAPQDRPQMNSPSAWQDWLKANGPYLFFSDAGDFRWYVDPLAKARGVASSELRGVARASK